MLPTVLSPSASSSPIKPNRPYLKHFLRVYATIPLIPAALLAAFLRMDIHKEQVGHIGEILLAGLPSVRYSPDKSDPSLTAVILSDERYFWQQTTRLWSIEPAGVIEAYQGINALLQKSDMVAGRLPPAALNRRSQLESLLASFRLKYAQAWILAGEIKWYLRPQVAAAAAVMIDDAAETFAVDPEKKMQRVKEILELKIDFGSQLESPEGAVALVALKQQVENSSGNQDLTAYFLEQFAAVAKKKISSRRDSLANRGTLTTSLGVAADSREILEALGVPPEEVDGLVNRYLETVPADLATNTRLTGRLSLTDKTFAFARVLPPLVRLYGPRHRAESTASLTRLGLTKDIVSAIIFYRFGDIGPEFVKSAVEIGFLSSDDVSRLKRELGEAIARETAGRRGLANTVSIGDETIEVGFFHLVDGTPVLERMLDTVSALEMDMSVSGQQLIDIYLKRVVRYSSRKEDWKKDYLAVYRLALKYGLDPSPIADQAEKRLY